MSQLEALLNGIRHLESVSLSDLEGPEEVLVRPLSDAEAGKVDAIRMAAIKGQPNIETGAVVAMVDDLGKLMEQQRKARIQAVAYGLSHSEETCSYEQAAKLPSPWVARLSKIIFRISGVQTDEESFRLGEGDNGLGGEPGAGNVGIGSERDSSP